MRTSMVAGGPDNVFYKNPVSYYRSSARIRGYQLPHRRAKIKETGQIRVPKIMKPSLQTPCRGICSTGIGGVVCRGCKRFDHEVIAWNSYSFEQRASVMGRLEQFTIRIMAARCEILDQELLLQQVREQKVRFDEAAHPYCWLYDLLRAGAGQIRNPRTFGFQPLSAWQALPLAELFNDAERALLALSEAHYERYVAPRIVVADNSGEV